MNEWRRSDQSALSAQEKYELFDTYRLSLLRAGPSAVVVQGIVAGLRRAAARDFAEPLSSSIPALQYHGCARLLACCSNGASLVRPDGMCGTGPSLFMRTGASTRCEPMRRTALALGSNSGFRGRNWKR